MNLPASILRLLLGERPPITTGTLDVPGLNAPITIRRDGHGVPYIRAENAEDGWYGLGFCHGQDRAFQLETILRLVRGTLSERYGEDLLPTDRLSRRIGFHRTAVGHLKVMPQDQIDILAAYTHGVNAGSSTGMRARAHEFALLRADPTPWTPVDVMAMLNYMGINLSGWTGKLTRLFVLTSDGPEAVKALDFDYPEWMLVSAPVGGKAGKAVERLMADAETLLSHFGAGGSNNWAIAGANTAGGNPILANDPHLAPVLPAQWYLAHVSYPGLTVCGASFVGLPLIPSGFNGTAAWGITAGLADGIDLYIEDLDPKARTVRTGDAHKPCKIIREEFHVRGRREPVIDEVLLTPRGPIISDMFEGIDQTLSMKATWMNPRPVDGITNFHRSSSFQDCRENFEHIYITSMNVAYADTHGTIGWQLIGEVPRRKKSWGTLPMAGWDPEEDWGTDLVPLEEMPWTMNPDCGYLATANNLPIREGDGPYLGRDFTPYRHGRIMKLLSQRDDWDLEAASAMQLDRYSLPWREIREHVLAVETTRPDAQAAQEMLAGWDGVLSAGSGPAAVYEYFMISMARALAAAKAPFSLKRVLGKGFSRLFPRAGFFYRYPSLITHLLRERPDGWFAQRWGAVVEDALETAFVRLKEDSGPDSSAWRWGDRHTLVLRHAFGSRKPFDRIYNRGPFPTGGDHDTVAQAGKSISEYGSHVSTVANLRMAVEVGNWENNRFIIAGGQSGNPLSPHYDDQLKLWLKGESISLAWSEAAIQKRLVDTLRLEPAS